MQIKKIHHVAYRCKDAKETVEWYGKHLNMKFVLAIAEDQVPSTHAPDPYMHLFMDAGQGNVLAFFEIPNSAADGPRREHPGMGAAHCLRGGQREDAGGNQGAARSRGHPGGRHRPTTRSSSRSISSTRAATAWSWPPIPARPRCTSNSTR